MGGKRTGQRVHLYLFPAAVILFAALGFAATDAIAAERGMTGDLRNAQRLFAAGELEPSLGLYERIVRDSRGQPPADQALFGIGLIFIHPGYRGMDRQKATKTFKRLIEEHPESARAPEAKVLITVLDENVKLKKALSEAVNENARLQEIIEKSREIDIEIEQKKKGGQR